MSFDEEEDHNDNSFTRSIRYIVLVVFIIMREFMVVLLVEGELVVLVVLAIEEVFILSSFLNRLFCVCSTDPAKGRKSCVPTKYDKV